MDVINSFFSNIKDKFTNPFFGTLIIVLLIDHWELWYAIFNFDDALSLASKIQFIKNYVSINITFLSFLWDIAQAVLYMFAGYLVVVGTRSLVMWIEFYLMPLITRRIVNKNVVRKEEYDQVVKEREEYFDQYEEQRENVRKFSKTIDEQTEEIRIKNNQILEQNETITETINKLNIKTDSLDKLNQRSKERERQMQELKNSLNQAELNEEVLTKRVENYQSLFFNPVNKDFYNSISKFPPEIILKVQELKSEDKWDTFIKMGKFFQGGGGIGENEINDMVDKGILLRKGKNEEFTPTGFIIWHYRKILDNEDNFDIW